MNNSWNFNMFKPNYYVDISKTLKIKMKALKAYRHENKKLPNPVSLEGIKILAQFRGLESGFKYAEVLKLKDYIILIFSNKNNYFLKLKYLFVF